MRGSSRCAAHIVAVRDRSRASASTMRGKHPVRRARPAIEPDAILAEDDAARAVLISCSHDLRGRRSSSKPESFPIMEPRGRSGPVVLQ